MRRKLRNICYAAAILLTAGCGKEETENVFPDGILIEVEAPQTDGWSTEEIAGTRGEGAKAVKLTGEDGLDMEASTHPDTAEAPTGNATTRWTNLDDGITFRVVAYKTATAAGISTSNYVAYGDYKLSGNSVQTKSNLVLPTVGTYTFVFYSYGNASTIAAFANSSTSVSATNGDNFMTCVKPGVAITNIGSKYTLSNIVFKHHCVRYRVVTKAQSGRMGKITACSGTVTLPTQEATYAFTNGAFTIQSGTGTTSIAWNSPNDMNVYSNYTYLLPQSSANITVKLNPTIGGKAFANKSATLSGLTLAANKTYYSSVSFTTTQGYIIRGAFWAGGNLYYDGLFKIYGNQYDFNTTRGHDFWRFGALYPTSGHTNPWSTANDPCRKVSPNGWRLPVLAEYNLLIQGFSGYSTQGGKRGALFDNILFFPATGYYSGGAPDVHTMPERGLYWDSSGMLDFATDNSYTPIHNGSDSQNNYMTIRCVRAD